MKIGSTNQRYGSVEKEEKVPANINKESGIDGRSVLNDNEQL